LELSLPEISFLIADDVNESIDVTLPFICNQTVIESIDVTLPFICNQTIETDDNIFSHPRQ
jgi:hypothetical protein